MACLEMYNNSSAAATTSASTSAATSAAANYFSAAPRISFSTDFADSSHPTVPKSPLGPSAAASSMDFEFSVGNHPMMAADELFFKGQMLPFKDSGGGARKPTTLREELLAGDEEGDGGVAFCRPPKGPTRWKGFLGLRKSHIGSSSKKSDHHKLPPSVAAGDQDAAMHND